MIQLEILEQPNLDLYIEFFVEENGSIQEKVDINANPDKIMEEIKDIIEGYGYAELDHRKSPKSTSLYFTFSNAEKYNTSTVNLIARMRVADHVVQKHKDDKTRQDAINRQIHDLQKFADKYKNTLNKDIKQDEIMPVKMLYVMYENEFYTDLEYVYYKIRKKLEWFKNKYG